jgi:uroporphyrin-III C-methyltransferase/precorrin-2 dehydrogenase/sirohydrochlorin ferrochelatase
MFQDGRLAIPLWSMVLRYFPVFLDLDQRSVVVTGGGEKAAQKLRLLTRTPGHVRVFAEHACAEIQALAAAGRVTISAAAPGAADLDRTAAVFVANDDPALARAIAETARAAGVPVNVVDEPTQSTFIVPAIVDRSPVTVAIGTEGTAPILARQIKAHLDQWLPANLGALATAAQALRARVKAEITSPEARRQLWDRLLGGAFRNRVLANDQAGAMLAADGEISAFRQGIPAAGSVALIGCGPGDPELLTLKAHQRLQEADVLVIDRLVDPAVLEYARRDARRIEVGKKAGGPSTAQEEINRILVREALMGHRVARLKGGDAFIFGRAAEEMAAVRAAGIPVEIIPGVTAAHACAASVGLPLTLRRKVRQFSVVTGGTADDVLDLDWQALAQPGQAFAIYMGLASAPVFRDRLIAAGADSETTVVIVENGTLPKERSMQSTLKKLPDTIRQQRVEGPAVVLVGLDWDDAHLTRPGKVAVVAAKADEQGVTPAEPIKPAMTPEELAIALYWTAG